MKKFLLSVFLVTMCLVSMAQVRDMQRPQGVVYGEVERAIPEWSQIAEPFVATDIYGNTVDLGAILESGKVWSSTIRAVGASHAGTFILQVSLKPLTRWKMCR